MNKKIIIITSLVIVSLIAIGGVKVFSTGNSTNPVPTPTPTAVEQLSPDKYPQVSLDFSADGHYVTVNLSKLQAASLEYNLIYDAIVKKNQVNTGVTGSTKLEGKDSYTYRQLLGSESSGKFTFHEEIKNAVMELTLRDTNRYSIFSATYPFEVSPGKSLDLSPAQ